MLKWIFKAQILIKGMLLAFVIFSSQLVFSSLVTKAEFFELDSKLKKKAFNWTKEVEKSNGVEIITTKSMDLTGKILVKEVTELKGGKISKLTVEQLQTNKKGVIEVKGEKVLFKYFENGKQTKEDDEDLENNFVIPSTLVAYIEKNWKKLMNDDSVNIRFGVWHRLETVGFKFFKERSFKAAPKPGEAPIDIVEIKMKPTSFVIAALVDPLFFRFTKDGKKLLSMKGRVAPKKLSGKKWKDWDAEGLYTYFDQKSVETETAPVKK